MPQVAQGQTTVLAAEFFAYLGGPAVDVTGLTIAIQAPDGSYPVPATSTGIVHVSTGLYNYTWTAPLGAQLGDYVITWSGTGVTATDLVTVTSSTTTTWCTTDDVLTYTSVTVTDTQLVQAGAMIDVACGRPYSLDGDPSLNRIGSRDRYWLKVATAWQAAWIVSQPDAFQRTDALAVQAGRRMITLRDTALFLSVNARKALKRVSWLKSRAIHVKSPFQDGVGAGILGMDPDSSAADDIYPWSSVG